MTRRGWLVGIVIVLASAVAFADGKPDRKSQVVGRWQWRIGYTIEFTADGRVKVKNGTGSRTLLGAYKWIDNEKIEIEIEPDYRVPKHSKVAIDGDELILNGTYRYSRVK